MKKTILYIVMASLCLNFGSNAQNINAGKPLEIGDKIPDITINNVINYSSQSVKISDFRGKILILDFWATWCSPCVAMIPKMDSLQNEFNGKIQFLPVSYQPASVIEPFLKKFSAQQKRSFSLPDVTNDTTLIKLFPHSALPHYVWIDTSGRIVAITEFTDVNEKNISNLLHGKIINAAEKKDDARVMYNPDKPLFISGNGGDGSKLIYHSLLSGNSPGIGSGYNFKPYNPEADEQIKISVRNYSIIQLFQLAYGKGMKFYNRNSLAVEVADSAGLTFPEASGPAYEDWHRQHSYCYELIVPHNMGASAFELMQQDLNRFFFPYTALVEKKKIECLALIRTTANDKVSSKTPVPKAHFDRFGCLMLHYPLSAFVQELNVFYMQNSSLPIVDATGYKGMVDLEVNTSLSDLDELNIALEKYDIRFVKTQETVEILVIKDGSSKPFLNPNH